MSNSRLSALSSQTSMRASGTGAVTYASGSQQQHDRLARHQSHPRRVLGYLTVTQLAEAAGVSPSWLYDRIHNGRIPVQRDADHKLYLFPDTEPTRRMIQQLKDEDLKEPRHTEEYQHV